MQNKLKQVKRKECWVKQQLLGIYVRLNPFKITFSHRDF